MPSSLFFRNARQLLTLAGPAAPRRGRDLSELGIIEDGAVLTRGAVIERVGRTPELEAEARHLKAEAIDCQGRVVMPGFVDCHTHLVFAGHRLEDYELRLRGVTGPEIARRGGGIQLSARQVGAATQDELVAQAQTFLHQFAAHGTTTIEVKSGYGLDVANELKILEVVRKLQKISPLELVPTLMAAHALPTKFEKKRAAYIKMMEHKLIPLVARKKLAEFVDCFCDRAAFTREECSTLLRAGARLGLIPRIHAEQMVHTGSTRLAIALGAASADHLDNMTAPEIGALARSNVVAVMLPGANFHLATRSVAPARRLIEMGAAVAVATDFNPGTSPTLNLQFILSLACSTMRMMPAEAVAASTINAAYSLRRNQRCGSLEPGKQADLAVMDVDDYRMIPYYFGWNHCVMTVKNGSVIWARDR
ncbi:MAG TPA: imidazolonepropionase [Terriglobia bacterium]|nr:imidazolonepropionase [Terriglobia bacterium]